MSEGNGRKWSKNFQEVIGTKYGRMEVVSFLGKKKGVPYLLCKCECGTEKEVSAYNFLKGDHKSCGCFRQDFAKLQFTTHGYTHSPEYNSWCALKARCFNKNDKGFDRYGGRGITVCFLYKTNFEEYIKDAGARPSKFHSIDRVDNNGHYSCGKCDECIENDWKFNLKWSTKKQQNRNRRSNKIITYKNQTKTLAEWVEKIGIEYHTLKSRLNRGWSVEEAFTTPVGPSRKN